MGTRAAAVARPQTPNSTAVPTYESSAANSATRDTTTTARAVIAVGRAPIRSVREPPSQLPTRPATPKTSRSVASAVPLPPVTPRVTAELKM